MGQLANRDGRACRPGVSSKNSPYTSLYPAKSSMSTRYVVTVTRSPSPAPTDCQDVADVLDHRAGLHAGCRAGPRRRRRPRRRRSCRPAAGCSCPTRTRTRRPPSRAGSDHAASAFPARSWHSLIASPLRVSIRELRRNRHPDERSQDAERLCAAGGPAGAPRRTASSRTTPARTARRTRRAAPAPARARSASPAGTTARRPCRASRRSSPAPSRRSPRCSPGGAARTAAAPRPSRRRVSSRQRSSSTTSSNAQFAPCP